MSLRADERQRLDAALMRRNISRRIASEAVSVRDLVARVRAELLSRARTHRATRERS